MNWRRLFEVVPRWPPDHLGEVGLALVLAEAVIEKLEVVLVLVTGHPIKDLWPKTLVCHSVVVTAVTLHIVFFSLD